MAIKPYLGGTLYNAGAPFKYALNDWEEDELITVGTILYGLLPSRAGMDIAVNYMVLGRIAKSKSIANLLLLSVMVVRGVPRKPEDSWVWVRERYLQIDRYLRHRSTPGDLA